MYAEIGAAISQWSLVESGLCGIFSCCISPTNFHPPGGVLHNDWAVVTAAFFAVENFRSKLKLVDSTINARLSALETDCSPILSEWVKARDKCRRLSMRRNHLAHGTVIGAPRSKPGNRILLKAAFNSPDYNQVGGRSLNLNSVRHITKGFSLLERRISNVRCLVAALPELPHIFASQVANQMENAARNNPSVLAQIKRGLSWPE